jgi:hypothetical protein
MNIHVITSGKKFAVVKEGYSKATKLFNSSEQAFYYARKFTVVSVLAKNKTLNINEDISIVVHDKNGSVKFMETVYKKTI